MIKRIHGLKAKKGFTLVELIVVIAIIGVLAAILVPTMLGMVTKSRITSANSTATSAQKTVNAFFLQAEIAGYGMKRGCFDVLDVTVVKSGTNVTWSCTPADSSHFVSRGSNVITWGNAATFTSGGAISGITSGEELLCATLSGAFPEIDHAAFVVVLNSGVCSFIAYTTEQTTALGTSDYPTITNGTPPASFAWNNKTAGVSPSGIIIGTAPEIPLG